MVWHQRRSAIALLEREQRSLGEAKHDSGQLGQLYFFRNVEKVVVGVVLSDQQNSYKNEHFVISHG